MLSGASDFVCVSVTKESANAQTLPVKQGDRSLLMRMLSGVSDFVCVSVTEESANAQTLPVKQGDRSLLPR